MAKGREQRGDEVGKGRHRIWNRESSGSFRLRALLAGGAVVLALAGCGPPDAQDGSPEDLEGVPRDASRLELRLRILDLSLLPEETGAYPVLERLVSGQLRTLSHEEGREIFDPDRVRLEVLEPPKILVEAGKRAGVEMAREFQYPTAFVTDPESGETTPGNYERAKVGVMMNVRVKPTVDPGVVEARIDAMVREFLGFEPEAGSGGLRKPRFESFGAPFEGEFPNGGYLYIGNTAKEETVERKRWFLGHLPGVGRLFRREEEVRLQRHLAVQVTVAEAKAKLDLTPDLGE